MTNTNKKAATMRKGDIRMVSGHEFEAVRVWVGENGVTYFEGRCTDSERNNSIRHTGYNGGTYSDTKA